MVDSPLTESSGPVRVSVRSNGAATPESTRLLSVEVERRIAAIPRARLVIEDGDTPTGQWAVADSGAFAPGAVIEIKAGYGDSEATVFEGIVVKLGMRISGAGSGTLIVECRDKAVSMTLGLRSAVYVDQTDSDVVGQLCAGHGLATHVDATTANHPALAQAGCTDWDFMLARAQANGLLVIPQDGVVSVRAPNASGPVDLKVTYGFDLIDFQADVDARTQRATVEAVAWDPATQDVARATAAPQVLNTQGDLTAGALASAIGSPGVTVRGAPALGAAGLQDLAKAHQTLAGLARIRGRLSFHGSAKARVGGLIELAGVGARFSGPAFVGGVTHRISDGQWITEVDIGAPETLDAGAQRDGSPSGVSGLQVGIVLQTGGDPQGEARVLVKAPLLSPTGVWARLAQVSASNGFGAFLLPEAGDEVVLGHFDDDPSQPVILGSLYSSRNPPPYAADAASRTRGLVTRSRTRIEIDDDDPSVTIVTPGENRIVVSDRDRSIRLSDQSGNAVTLGAGGIRLESPRDITISAKGSLNLEAVAGLSIAAAGDVSVAGLNVALRAKAAFSGAGAASAELVADGQTIVKGAMVLIN